MNKRIPPTRDPWRDLRLLEAVEERSTITQRSLAARLGIALGLANLYVKRLVNEGYIKRVIVHPRRVAYRLTARGAHRKARLVLDFMRHSLGIYRDVRRHLRRGLENRVGIRQRVALYGTGDAAALTFLMLREIGIEPVGVFDGAGAREFLAIPVRPITEHAEVAYDVLVVAMLEGTKPVVADLVAVGVARNKLLILDEGIAARAAPGRRRS